MDSKQILPLLGLCLRGGRLAVGEEPVEAVGPCPGRPGAVSGLRRGGQHPPPLPAFRPGGRLPVAPAPFTKAELGQAVGRRAAAIVAVTDIGLAANIVHRLEALDSAKYGEAAARLDLKAKRAAERRAEQQAHERNLRQGKRRPKRPPSRATLRRRKRPNGPTERRVPPVRPGAPKAPANPVPPRTNARNRRPIPTPTAVR